MTTNFTLAPPLPLSGGPLHPSTPYPSPTLGFKLDPIVSPPIQKTKAAWQGFTSISLPPPFSRYSLLHPESSYPLEDVRESRVSNGTLSVVSRHSKNPGGSRSALLSDDGPKDGVQVNPRKGLRLGSQKNFSSKPSSSSFSSPTSPTSLSTTKMTAGTLTNHQKPAQDPCRFVGDSKAIPWIPHLPIDVLRVRDADDALEDFLPQIVKDGNVNCISFAVNKVSSHPYPSTPQRFDLSNKLCPNPVRTTSFQGRRVERK
ncbi:hypothetical protein IE53DRAFT_386562 [Violaceomyces palustris]|uniref:Uncharacterized protein n=1 Tax=Violaceomyces palustris TaxID=1673888 RepID=A0ACD0NYY1_9BASI|nr:hypothetical protein IE53DRAFT_386562 [Violaceomyces palustris]